MRTTQLVNDAGKPAAFLRFRVVYRMLIGIVSCVLLALSNQQWLLLGVKPEERGWKALFRRMMFGLCVLTCAWMKSGEFSPS